MSAFEDFGVMPEIVEALERMGWLLPTAVQAEAIPMALGGGDLLVAAETGAGKTGAFCIPIVQIVWESLRSIDSVNQSDTSEDRAALSAFDHDAGFSVNEDESCESTHPNNWQGGRATYGVGKGKYMYEITLKGSGLCRVGWSSATASLVLGTDAQGFGFGSTGKKSVSSKFEDYGEPYGASDVITCLIDFTSNAISYKKNGKLLGNAFKIPQGSFLFPAILLKACAVDVNFGGANKPFQHPEPDFQPFANASDTDKKTKKQLLALSSKNTHSPLAIVLEPSRELAVQTLNELEQFQSCLPPPKMRHMLLIGGQTSSDQEKEIDAGVDLIVATPGRLLDLVSKNKIDLTEVRFLILDEADDLAKSNSKDIVDLYHKIPKQTPRKQRLQVMFFSATLQASHVRRLANDITQFPTWIDLKGSVYVPETVQHVVAYVNPSDLKQYEAALLSGISEIQTDGIHKADKLPKFLQVQGTAQTAPLVASTQGGTLLPEAVSELVKRLKGFHLVQILKKLNIDRAIIFARTKVDCDHLEDFLKHELSNDGKPNEICVVLHSDRSNNERLANLDRFRNGKCKYLICTDVAARGIDIKGLPYLINYTLPDEPASYVHRVGRVGRADLMGLAISLVSTTPEKVWYHTCNKKNCVNTSLTDQGGCAIWYNEVNLLKEIEKYLDMPIDILNEEVEAILLDPQKRAMFGAKRQREPNTNETHAAELAPAVSALAALEDQAHALYYRLKTRKFLTS